MVKMSNNSRAFLEVNLPGTLEYDWFCDILDELYDLIEEKGYAPPHYYDYNDFGREAQKVYDDIFLSNNEE